jgi:GrpB-like predicted nucleotidyltransferase (UPF0157 family)
MAAQADGTDPQRRDQQLQELTVGTQELHNAPITLTEYDADWPRSFSREADRLHSVLGEVALGIQHVGSTSVPGLIAKPIIDILLVVSDSADEQSYVPHMEAAGYVLRIREPDWFEHRLFNGPDTSINLHVFSSGAPEVERMLRFRDRLRDDDVAREQYLRTKRPLAQRIWRHVQDYADAKTAVIQKILGEAEGRTHREQLTDEVGE